MHRRVLADVLSPCEHALACVLDICMLPHICIYNIDKMRAALHSPSKHIYLGSAKGAVLQGVTEAPVLAPVLHTARLIELCPRRVPKWWLFHPWLQLFYMSW